MFKKYITNQRGVTLIELLAVVIILGIIAAIAAPTIFDSFDSAKKNSDEATARILIDATKKLIMDKGGFAKVDNNSTLGFDYETTSNVVKIYVGHLVTYGYIEKQPTWGNGSNIDYVIVTKDANGKYSFTFDPQQPASY